MQQRLFSLPFESKSKIFEPELKSCVQRVINLMSVDLQVSAAAAVAFFAGGDI
jgi:hypothetical protein